MTRTLYVACMLAPALALGEPLPSPVTAAGGDTEMVASHPAAVIHPSLQARKLVDDYFKKVRRLFLSETGQLQRSDAG